MVAVPNREYAAGLVPPICNAPPPIIFPAASKSCETEVKPVRLMRPEVPVVVKLMRLVWVESRISPPDTSRSPVRSVTVAAVKVIVLPSLKVMRALAPESCMSLPTTRMSSLKTVIKPVRAILRELALVPPILIVAAPPVSIVRVFAPPVVSVVEPSPVNVLALNVPASTVVPEIDAACTPPVVKPSTSFPTRYIPVFLSNLKVYPGALTVPSDANSCPPTSRSPLAEADWVNTAPPSKYAVPFTSNEPLIKRSLAALNSALGDVSVPKRE